MRVAAIVLAVLLAVLTGIALWLYTPDLPRAELESRYQQSPTDYQTVDGVRLHVRQEGPADAPVLVLIHGFSTSLQDWDQWAADLARDYRVVRFDLPGHGLTAMDPTGDYSVARTVSLLGGLLDALNIQRAGLIGNSLGGLVAWEYAAANPARVSKLVLLAPGGFVRPGLAYGQIAEVPAAFRNMRTVLPEGMVRQTLGNLYADKSRLNDAVVHRYYELLRGPGVRQALVDRLEDFKLEEPTARLQGLVTPTLLLWGEKDLMVPLDDGRKFSEALPNETLITYPDAGHLVMLEIPERSLADVRAFLSRN
jgi:pimeloyl-ACP methyl ester carboxylesterase